MTLQCLLKCPVTLVDF